MSEFVIDTYRNVVVSGTATQSILITNNGEVACSDECLRLTDSIGTTNGYIQTDAQGFAAVQLIRSTFNVSSDPKAIVFGAGMAIASNNSVINNAGLIE